MNQFYDTLRKRNEKKDPPPPKEKKAAKKVTRKKPAAKKIVAPVKHIAEKKPANVGLMVKEAAKK